MVTQNVHDSDLLWPVRSDFVTFVLTRYKETKHSYFLFERANM